MLIAIIVLLIILIALNSILIFSIVVREKRSDLADSWNAHYRGQIRASMGIIGGELAELRNTILGNKKSLKAKNGKHFRTDRE